MSRAAVCALLLCNTSVAGPRRARFEPTDLDLEKPGLLEIDAQFGVTDGDGVAGDRIVLPDFEVDLGLTRNVELNLDGAFAVDRFDRASRGWEGEALWTCVKLGLLDLRDPVKNRGFALGAQLGPRLPTLGARGVGYGALGLAGYKGRTLHSTLNLGYLVDPGPRLRVFSESVVTGVDFEVDLDARSTWSVMAGLAAAYYRTGEPTQLSVAAGFGLDLSQVWRVNAMLLGGVLPSEDRLGLFVGVTPRFLVW